jgi:hypothetical protein
MGVFAERWRLERRGDGDPDDLKGWSDRMERPAVGPRGPCWPWPFARAVLATDKGVQTDMVPNLEIEEVGEAALDDHTAVGDPVARCELGLIDG